MYLLNFLHFCGIIDGVKDKKYTNKRGENIMRKSKRQMSLHDTYDDVCSTQEENKSEFLILLKEHINLRELIPAVFIWAFYRQYGRSRSYSLEGFLWFFILQKIIGIEHDSTLLTVLKMSAELREFCGFNDEDEVPDASKITRFKQDFVCYIEMVFENLVEVTEPICRKIDEKKADYLIYDPTGIKVQVAENNPKFLNTKIMQAKKLSKTNPDLNPHALAYASMPDTATANPMVKQQYINGHFCYAFKAGILTNGLGIVRGISFFDEDFKRKHPEVVTKKTDNPEFDKEIGDSTSLKPVLSDFFETHHSFSYGTFIGDSAFDTYHNYGMLRDDFHFDRVAIPLNQRNSSFSKLNASYDDNGVPVCPIDNAPFTFLGVSGGKNRSERFKWVCHKSEKLPKSSKRISTCQTPCTDSSYGRCIYTYPAKDFRIYPGIPRGTEHWDNLYRHRILIERTIHILKDTLGGDTNKSYSTRTAKANLLLAGITQLVGVVLAHAINKPHLYKSIRKLVA